ncbi:malectin domain-containing carbohydrate-binding protein [Pontibacter sp. 13R65]|uniref:malectin domain-containing carbohydrate-binding protein n=1 Tax=Pontibacter sp. 13R65 TaxID=3127458 RepID=UPI00301D4052
MKNLFTYLLKLSVPSIRLQSILFAIALSCASFFSALAQAPNPVSTLPFSQSQISLPYNLSSNASIGSGTRMGLGLTSSTADVGLLATRYSGTNYISAAASEPAQSTVLVSDIASTTSRSYTLATIAVGANYYTDRAFQITSLPAFLNGKSLIRTANDDKSNSSTNLLSFNLSQTAHVYVAYDPRGTTLPAWLSDWQRLPDRIGINDSKIKYMVLYTKSYPAGTVTMGGNIADPAVGAQNNYFVLASEATATVNQPPVANAGPDKTITLPTSSVTLEGSGVDTDGTITDYTWTQVSGPSTASFNSTTIAQPTVSGLQAGSYVFSLVVRDNQNAPSPADEVTITVQSAPITNSCYPLSTLACDQVEVSLPYSLNFSSSVEGTLTDKNGVGTGFTMVDPYSGTRLSADGTPSNTNIPAYEPSQLTVASGRLQLVTNKGIGWLTNNNQINALGVRVDSRSRLTMEVALVNPYYGTSSQQAGLWFGLNDKTFIKLVVVGNKVELRREVNDASTTSDQRITGSISAVNNSTVRLRLVADPITNTIQASYSLNGGNQQNVGTALSMAGMELTSSTAYAGIFASHRNGSSPVTYTFDDFSITGVNSADLNRPYITAVRPANGATGVALDQSISVDLAFPSGASLDGATISPNTVKLYSVSNGNRTEVSGTAVNTTAAGDAITLTATLNLNTTYEFRVSDQVKDLNGYALLPFTSTFTTTSIVETIPPDLEGIAFTEQILVDNTFGNDGFTTLVIGPDRKLYAATSGGKIERWDIRPDGTIFNRITISPFGSTRRLLVGLRFDPAATADNLVAWLSHSASVFKDAPEWSSTISRINMNSPDNPQVVDYVINLPRSVKDHSIFSIDFGPDGGMYILQGGNTAMGAADPSWGNRPERLLSAALLRLDIAKAQQQALPIDAKTEEGGNYNPYAANAPLTLYATGIRNAYDLVWHSNGQLYVPTNGSAAGGYTPGLNSGSVWSNGSVYNGPTIPAMVDVRATQSDYLFRVEKGGYYGHPNVLRNEYIMNGGNPTAEVDPAEIVWELNGQKYGYPVGTPHEPNYRGFAFDFGLNMSPNGVIEYKSNAFGGRLAGKLLVCRFSGSDDILLLEPGGPKLDIVRSVEGSLIPGLRRPFSNPLDLVEDVVTGNLYLSEYFDGNGSGKPRITLLKVNQPTITTTVNAGGPLYTDSQSKQWGADGYHTGGTSGNKSFDVTGTTDDQLYLKYRLATSASSTTPGAPFSYNIPVSGPGTYTVKLHFVEPYYGAPGGRTSGLVGARVFHVDIEGQRALSNYDIYSQDGAGKAIIKTFENISVTDQSVDIVFTSVKNNAIVSAIEVLPGTPGIAKISSDQVASSLLRSTVSEEASLHAYPNPNTGAEVFIELKGFNKSETVALTLIDAAGRTILSNSVTTNQYGTAVVNLPLHKNINRGMYFIRAQSLSTVKAVKFVVD